MKRNFSVQQLTVSAVLIALNIVMTRFLSIHADPVRIEFGFIPIAFGSMLYGPFGGAVISVVADVIGALLDGRGYWPGFGLSAALYGVTYALFLYKRKKNWQNISLCAMVQAVFIDTALGAFWFHYYAGWDFWVAAAVRGVDALLMIPVKILLISYLWRYIGKRIEKVKL